MTYGFAEQLEFSKGARQSTDAQTIMSLLDGCSSVVPATVELDKKGVDYIATLRKGAEVYIDAKTRKKGCGKYWHNGEPEVSIELWSVMPGGKYNTSQDRSKAGWTLDEAKITDMILYTFDREDTDTAYLFPFQPLRMAAKRMIGFWMKRFKVDVQDSRTWESKAVFVPASEVILAIETTYSKCV